jgi:hypothetical protein
LVNDLATPSGKQRSRNAAATSERASERGERFRSGRAFYPYQRCALDNDW